MSSVLDIVTFDVFDFDGSRDMPNVNVNVPDKTETEKELEKLQLDVLRKQAAGPTAEELALQDKMSDYYETMMADEVLSEDEAAAFDEEYNLQLSALQDQFAIQTEEAGAARMAELASRGILETTTGRDIIAKDQQKYTDILGSNISELGEAKEIAKSDMELAKKRMAQQGYNLTSGILQYRQNDALTQAATMQNYYTNDNMMKANTALQNAIRTQTWDQWAYNQKMTSLGTTAGIGIGMMNSGFGGMGG